MARIRRSHNHSLRWPSRTNGENPMTARSRWGIATFAIVLIIVAVAFLGTTRNRNSVQALGKPADGATAPVTFASPGRVEGASETTQVGAAADGLLKAVYVKEGQFVKRVSLLGEIACYCVGVRLR